MVEYKSHYVDGRNSMVAFAEIVSMFSSNCGSSPTICNTAAPLGNDSGPANNHSARWRENSLVVSINIKKTKIEKSKKRINRTLDPCWALCLRVYPLFTLYSSFGETNIGDGTTGPSNQPSATRNDHNLFNNLIEIITQWYDIRYETTPRFKRKVFQIWCWQPNFATHPHNYISVKFLTLNTLLVFLQLKSRLRHQNSSSLDDLKRASRLARHFRQYKRVYNDVIKDFTSRKIFRRFHNCMKLCPLKL